ncbi:hypothetical protein CIL05_09990 [Virgibacillus profundi]|uniref:YusW-like protein n=1 Tax=Virgibacillus profundi TaxID=2024555 RepID=A0A2A2IEM0_9BACI|nr:YusW family protein [Virgibacillus profundi]PAV29694.1 hypothetical protein CIL05_09990 [Virgibacillus profundi]PXY53866.1 hypothetical protein CIT14_10085 [Virgibacillus profundi]
MTNKMKWLFPLLFIGLILTACGDDDEVENPPQNTTDNTQQEDTNNDDGNTNTETNDNNNDDNNTENDNDNDNDDNTSDSNGNTAYAFTGFSLEADFDDTNDTLDVDYDHETNETEASYEDKTQNINLQGDAAMEELDKIFSNFDFDESTADEDVLAAVSEAFSIPDDAKNVELEVDFSNGTEKVYRK